MKTNRVGLALVLVMGIAWCSGALYAEPVDVDALAAEIDSLSDIPTPETKKVKALLASASDPGGERAFREFSELVHQYSSRVKRADSDKKAEAATRAIYEIIQKNPYSDPRVSAGKADAHRTSAFKLFAKATFPRFLEGNPGQHWSEDVMSSLRGFAEKDNGNNPSAFFQDEMRATQRQLLERPEDYDSFKQAMNRAQRDTHWAGALPSDKQARVTDLANIYSSALSHMKNPPDLAQAVVLAESRNVRGLHGQNYQVDRYDVLMKMVEESKSKLRANPDDQAAKKTLSLLVDSLTVPSGFRPVVPTAVDAIVDSIAEDTFRANEATPDGIKLNQDNALRRLKRALVVEALGQATSDAEQRQRVDSEIKRWSASVAGVPSEFKACAEAYEMIKAGGGFFARSAPVSY